MYVWYMYPVYIAGLPRWLSVKNLPTVQEITYNAGDQGSVPGPGRSPGEGNGNTFQYSSLGKPMGRRGLAAYSSRGCKESDMT